MTEKGFAGAVFACGLSVVLAIAVAWDCGAQVNKAHRDGFEEGYSYALAHEEVRA